jgi:hypothetical protein
MVPSARYATQFILKRHLHHPYIESMVPGTLHDVTHLPCRSARYTPTASSGSEAGTPSNVRAGKHAQHV